ncbi:hypothetical protein B0181_08790 [Moraxella caviae]|uniref:Transglycosylase associated protein n=1 Tax=Moraxella caviae TaxID=34060 RepID=A0A1S9ZXK6_9GAMM|nr:hypothetical protein B0181_08790 [Moraxella caviae]STZ10528.1 Transglycosylase associated protein [Moraxella caviae]
MISAIVIGLLVGLVARAIKPGADSMGWIMTIILGIVGSFVGGFLFGADKTGFWGFATSVIGTIIVLFVYEFIRSRSR